MLEWSNELLESINFDIISALGHGRRLKFILYSSVIGKQNVPISSFLSYLCSVGEI